MEIHANPNKWQCWIIEVEVGWPTTEPYQVAVVNSIKVEAHMHMH